MWRSRCEMEKPDQGPNCERGWWWRPLQQWQSWWQKYDSNARLGSTRVLHMDVPKAGKETISFFAAYTPRAACTQRSGSMSWPHAFWFGRCAASTFANCNWPRFPRMFAGWHQNNTDFYPAHKAPAHSTPTPWRMTQRKTSLPAQNNINVPAPPQPQAHDAT